MNREVQFCDSVLANFPQEEINEIKNTFSNHANSVKYLLSQFINFNKDRPMKYRISFSLNIDRDVVIDVGGTLSAIRTNTSAKDLNGNDDSPFYQNHISVYTNNGQFYQAFLDSELLDTEVFAYKKELVESYKDHYILKIMAISIDKDDVNLLNSYFIIGDIASKYDLGIEVKYDGGLPIIKPSDKAIIETSEGG